jgi:hypothetical protein
MSFVCLLNYGTLSYSIMANDEFESNVRNLWHVLKGYSLSYQYADHIRALKSGDKMVPVDIGIVSGHPGYLLN